MGGINTNYISNITTQPMAAGALCHRCSSYRLVPSPPYIAPLLYVSNSILHVVCEVYLVNDLGMVIGYRIGYWSS